MITEEPALTPITAPDVASTVATSGLAELQVPPATVEENVVRLPLHTAISPLSTPTIGGAFIVTNLVSIATTPPRETV